MLVLVECEPVSDSVKDYQRMYRRRNKEKIAEQKKAWCVRNKEKVAADNKLWREQNKQRVAAQEKAWRVRNREKIAADSKLWREQHKEKIAEQKKAWCEKNKERLAAKTRKYIKLRLATDPTFKFVKVCRYRTWFYFKLRGIPKSKSTLEMLGCTPEQLRDHLQSQFTEGMTLQNHGEWHIDHIIPLASAKTEAEIIKLCHYTNLQPLWAQDNLSKSDKLAA